MLCYVANVSKAPISELSINKKGDYSDWLDLIRQALQKRRSRSQRYSNQQRSSLFSLKEANYHTVEEPTYQEMGGRLKELRALVLQS